MSLSKIRYYLTAICMLLIAEINIHAVSVFADLDGGKISGAQIVNPGATPQLLGNEISPSGGVGGFTYQWELSVDEISWTLINGAVNVTYQPAGLTKTTYFRRKVISGADYCYSNTVQVAVNSAATLNTPSAGSVTAIAPVVTMPGYSGVVPDNLKSVTTYFLRKPIGGWSGTTGDLQPGDYKQVTGYVDGIYRPIQNVSYKASNGTNDIVDVIAYDQYGRQIVKHLPYIAPTDASNAGKFRLDAATQQPQYYKGLTANQEDYFYNAITTDPSPISRTTEMSLPGKQFAGNKVGVRTEQRTNYSYDNVRIWEIGDDASALPVSNGIYEKGMLTVKVTTNEHEAKTYEFIDREGKTVMTSVQSQAFDKVGDGSRTYYVYDGMRNLRYIISPLAVKYCVTNNVWNFAASQAAGNTLSNLCYKYIYDEKARVIIAEIPGATGGSSIVYDNRDRPVFIQDEAMKANGKGEWLVLFYDGLNRKVMTALYKNPAATRASLQAQMNQASATGQQTVSNPPVFDLTVTDRDPAQTLYTAGNSITFLPEFDSGAGGELDATINPGAVVSEIITINNPLPGITGYDPLEIVYYDNYDWNGAHSFDNSFQVNPGGALYPDAVTPVNVISGQIAGYKTKVLGRNQWLTTTVFYDRNGRMIQGQSENITGGLDMTTIQYDFSGKVLSTYFVTKNPQATDKPVLQRQLRYEYDVNDKVTQTYHTIWNGSTPATKLISENTYDALGSLIETKLGSLETLTYEYNYLQQLKGINTAYVHDKTLPNYFGMEFSYANGFATKRMDGNISGVTWRRKGNPDEWHAYGFSYDNAGNLSKADYTQNASGSWSNGTVDYTAGGIEYDENGNIKKMKQNGMLLGNVKAGIDDLTYTYDNSNYSNQLLTVSDVAGNKQQGDFKDLANVSKEYEFDVNGNLTVDRNKGISITYDQLINKPETITLANEPGKSIRYIYDAKGKKLQKIVTDNGTVTTYTYIRGAIYKNDKLLLFEHPEGRVRNNANGTLIYDYFIKDHLGNVRTVLTEETNQLYYRASHEDNPQPVPAIPERDAFTFPANIDVIPVTNKFYDYNGTNRKFVRLNSSDPSRKTGTAKVLKVMAGDKIELGVQTYYATNSASNNTPSDLANQIVTQLVNSLLGPVSVVANGKNNIVESNATGIMMNTEDFTTFVNNNQSANPPSDVPKAYLNYVLFDDNFKMVDGRALRVSTPGAIAPLAGSMDIKKNGYLYVYISNESPTDVFFDDLVVKHTTGPLLQEDSYYPFGLQMRGLSSMALNRLQNDYLYNGIEKISEFDLEVYDAGYRNLDPQTGRWWQLDPRMEDAAAFTPYGSNFNDPVNLADPEGDWPIIDGAELWSLITKSYGQFAPLFTFRQGGNMVLRSSIEGGTMQFATGSFNYIEAYKKAWEAAYLRRLAADLQKLPGAIIPPPTVDPGAIKPFKSSFMNDWSESHNIVANVTYEMSDDFWVTIQSLNPLVNPSSISHLNRSGLTGNARVEAFVNTTNNIVSNYVAGEILKAAAPLLGGLGGRAGRIVKITQERIGHIMEEHFIPGKIAAATKNKFLPGTTADELREMIEIAVKKGVARPNTAAVTGEARAGTIYEYKFAKQIGEKGGGPAFSIRVIVREDGFLKTALPF